MTNNIKIVLGVALLGAVLWYVFKKPENEEIKEPAHPNVDNTNKPTNSTPNT